MGGKYIGVAWGTEGEVGCKGYEERLGVMDVFCVSIGMVVEWVYSFVKTHQSMHLKWMHFIARKFTQRLFKILKDRLQGNSKSIFPLV